VEVCVLSVSTALERLRDCLSDDFPPSSGTRIFDIPFPLHDAFDPLLWCGHQAQWPQFYWQQRNGDEELAALGAVKPSRLWPRLTASCSVRGWRIYVFAA
jgi:menaquinone-specific isochorismate synthase